jgi:RNA polymerase sigma factor for flagellar operon FliA
LLQAANMTFGTEAYGSPRLVEGLTREEVCTRYQGKVMLLARRLAERLPPDASMQYEDLVSCGAIGLLEAFERYDEGRQIQFSTFAEYRIRGAMLDALRSNDSFTRRRRQLANRIADATEAVRREVGREPRPEEVADRLEVDLETYWSAIDRVQPVSMVSIDATSDDDDEGRSLLETLVTGPVDGPDRMLVIGEIKTHLRESIKALPDRHRQCILMYYGKEMSLAEIAEVYGVTPSRISQILSDARRRLRKKLDRVMDLEDLNLEGVVE